MSPNIRIVSKTVQDNETLEVQGREILFRNFSDEPVTLDDTITLPARREVSTGVFWPYELRLPDMNAYTWIQWKIRFAETATIKRLEVLIRS